MSRFLIHASNVHQGGGAVLLADLLRSIPQSLPVTATIDTRMVLPDGVPVHVCIERVRPSLLGRLLAEYRLSRRTGQDDSVLCFGNLPPLFKLKGDITVFLQNRYLVDRESSLAGLPLKTRLRLLIERVWLGWHRDKAKRYIVQTASMKRLTEARLGIAVECAPFVPESVMNFSMPSPDDQKRQYDFIYVASGEAHKNHEALIGAWCILADEGLFPSLALTLVPEMASKILTLITAESISRGVRIQNLGELSYESLIAVYRTCGALIYPSSLESFGLPLIEARRVGLAVLAPELDYVRDITDPEETFEPRSPVSIARAVKRYMKDCKSPFEPITASTFVDQLIRDQAS